MSAMAASQPSVTFDTPKSVKALAAELPSHDNSINPIYTFQETPNIVNDEAISAEDGTLPTIDFSLLISTNPEERSKAIQDLGRACQDWGFFMLINHGVPESLFKAIMDGSAEFFDLPEEEKMQFKGKGILDPINYGSLRVGNVSFWRDFLKVFLHPQFHSINKPPGFSETSFEFGKELRRIVSEILRGISKSLGLEEDYLHKELNLENGQQIMAVNLYPPCPKPELALGLPPHSDYGLLNILITNGIAGLQVKHQGKWVKINPLPNSITVNIGDHIEIVSNGKYKSVMHRAVVNKENTRMSIATGHGPALDAVVSPAAPLLDPVNNPPIYKSLTYREYVELLRYGKLADGDKAFLNQLRI